MYAYITYRQPSMEMNTTIFWFLDDGFEIIMNS